MVGAGIGGLSAAVDLAAHGFEVTVVERAPHAGGKLRAEVVGGRAIDAGPTVLTMRWVFEEMFAEAGRSLDDYAKLERAHVLARHVWPDGSRLDLFADRRRSAEAIAALSGDAEAQRFRTFMDHAERTYRTVEGPFLRSPRPSFVDLVRHAGVVGPLSLARIDAHRTMWRALASTLRDPRLVQLFGRYATYVGSSPFEAPATLNLVAHVEADGVYRVAGGMVALAAAVERLARELGVAFRMATAVEEIEVRSGRVTAVRTEGGEVYPADAVVSNGDVSALGERLLGAGVAAAAKSTPRADRSLSALTWALVARPKGVALSHHNVFFSEDYAAEFDSMLGERRRVPDDPTVYVCAQDRGDEASAAGDPGDERMLVIVNAPATGDEPERWSNVERKRCEEVTWGRLERSGLSLAVSAGVATTPVELARAFPATGGALYGPRAKGALSSLSRAGSRCKIAGLYLTGGSVHPGPGVPMATLSGRLAAAAVRQDLASTAPSRMAVTAGTTSTA